MVGKCHSGKPLDTIVINKSAVKKMKIFNRTLSFTQQLVLML
ncbi:hypothetical protein NT08PM_1028 [Pasteurella multocida subsp. multocida str. 3480]|nr:hypothetical protein NT08PM_1028 [Pasteurella multocida subsp. multocida str. 3480]